MTFRKLVTLLAVLVLGAALAGPVGAEEGDDEDGGVYAEDAFPTEAVIVGTQRAGTFGGSPEEAALGTALGADLREGRIRMLDAETLEFVVQLESLPPSGGAPEVIRYTWDFLVDGKDAQFDGKWSNYSRGACDPTSGQCDPPEKLPRDPGMQPFLFRANNQQTCLGVEPEPVDVPVAGPVDPGCVGSNFSSYDEMSLLQGSFDTDEATITILLPVADLALVEEVEFGPCSRIAPRGGLFGGTIEAMPSAFISSNAFPHDMIPPAPAKSGGGVFQAPPPADFETCADYEASQEG